MAEIDYDFTNSWFDANNCRNNWPIILDIWKPKKILEIGSYEGASASFIIENLHSNADVYCVDTWKGSIEHKKESIDMRSVEERFDHNIALAISKSKYDTNLIKKKGDSFTKLNELICEGHCSSFDFIYVDGSHTAADVLLDALLSFKLLKIDGIMIFDDYLYGHAHHGYYKDNMLNTPKLGIDAFTSTHFNKIELIPMTMHQIFVKKLRE